jgi:hypothetical protein
MLVTEKFVFVHLPRTGGTFVSDIIKKFFPSAHEVGHHLPIGLLPREFSHLPVLGTVRNPWEFYVSLYHYLGIKDAKSVLASWMSDNGQLDFAASVRNLLNITVDDNRLDRLIGMLPERVNYAERSIPNVSKSTMRNVRGTGVAYLTLRFNEMFGNSDNIFFCQLETLGRDLVSFFEKIGIATNELCDYVRVQDKKNSSNHGHYSAYYSPELAELVAVRDRPLIQRFGYVFQQNETAEQVSPVTGRVISSCEPTFT